MHAPTHRPIPLLNGTQTVLFMQFHQYHIIHVVILTTKALCIHVPVHVCINMNKNICTKQSHKTTLESLWGNQEILNQEISSARGRETEAEAQGKAEGHGKADRQGQAEGGA